MNAWDLNPSGEKEEEGRRRGGDRYKKTEKGGQTGVYSFEMVRVKLRRNSVHVKPQKEILQDTPGIYKAIHRGKGKRRIIERRF